MSWSLLIPIIGQYGLPLAEALFKKWESNATPTQADFDELRLLGSQSAKDRMKAQLAQAGIAESSPQGIALLALVS
jgi:hypothetical protein